MKLTPAPLTVLAIIRLGLLFSLGVFCKISIKEEMSLPGVSVTLKPKDMNLSASGSIGLTSSVLPVICNLFLSMMTIKLSN